LKNLTYLCEFLDFKQLKKKVLSFHRHFKTWTGA